MSETYRKSSKILNLNFIDLTLRIVVDEIEEIKKRREKKRALKMKFDSQYDDKGLPGEGNAHYDELKKDAAAQTVVNRNEFEGMDDNLRIEYEGKQ